MLLVVMRLVVMMVSVGMVVMRASVVHSVRIVLSTMMVWLC